MPISIILKQQEEATDDVAKDPPRGEHPILEVEVEVERTPVPDSSPTSPPPIALAPTDTAGPSYAAQQSPDHIHVRSRELAAVMDVVYALATTQVSLDQWIAQAEVTIAHNHAMLLRIMSHLGLPPTSETEPAQPTRDQSTVAASLDMLAVAAAASDPSASPPPESEVVALPSLAFRSLPVETCLYFGWEEKLELGVSSIIFCLIFSFINCLLILYRIV